MKPRHTAEQSTVKLNKAEQIEGSSSGAPKKGFGATSGSSQPVSAGAPAAKKGFGFSGAKAGE
jgi:ribonucleoside-diphosphate reductase alpha chain